MRLVRTWLGMVRQSRLQHRVHRVACLGVGAAAVWMLLCLWGGFSSVGCSCGPHARFKRLARSGVYTARCKLLLLYQSCHRKYVLRSGAWCACSSVQHPRACCKPSILAVRCWADAEYMVPACPLSACRNRPVSFGSSKGCGSWVFFCMF